MHKFGIGAIAMSALLALTFAATSAMANASPGHAPGSSTGAVGHTPFVKITTPAKLVIANTK